MGLSKKPYRGTRDFFPADKRIQDYIFSKMKRAASLFGYEPYDGPLLEEVELYMAKSGEELINEQIYSFHDRGGRFVAIRPEMTPTLARMVAQVHREQSKPIRWYAIPNLMRYEKPQRGRLREHWQFNCDIFGTPGRQGELEIIQVLIFLLKSYGATKEHFEILINDRVIVDCVFQDLMNCDKDLAYKLYKIVDKAKKVSNEALKKMIDETGLGGEPRKIFEDYLELKSFDDVNSFLIKNNKDEIAKAFMEFTCQLPELSLTDYILYDPTVVRGLDYYTGIVFEVFDKHPENRRALCGGGAFGNLLQIFNEDPLPGVGFGLGDVTLRDFLESHNLLPDLGKPENDLYMTIQDDACLPLALKLANQLREKGISVVSHPEVLKFKKVFPNGEKKGARFVALMGDRELTDSTVQFKNMKTKEQFVHKLQDIDSIVKIFRQ